MLYADWMLNLLILGVIKTALPGKANSFFIDDRKEAIIPVRIIYKILGREMRTIAGPNYTYQQGLDHVDNIIPVLSSKIAASSSSANFTARFLQGSQTRLTRRQTASDSFAAGNRTKTAPWQDATINETRGKRGISLNETERNKEPYISSVSSEETSTVTSAPMTTSTISPLEDFFQSWEAILIITIATVCICCQFILCMMTRTRLRYSTCCERLLTTFEIDKDDEESLHDEDDDRKERKRKTSGTSWTSDHLKNIDYFDYLSETKKVDDMESADSSRRTSNDTLRSKSLKEGLKGPEGLFRQQSVDSQDSFSGNNERRPSGDSLGGGAVSILRTSSGDSLDKRPVDMLRSSWDSVAQRPRRKRKVSIDTSGRSSSDSLDGRPEDFWSRSPYDCYARKASGDSLDGGLRGILRRSSGDSYYRRPSGDSLGDGPIGILRRSSGDSLDGLPAWLPRNKPGDSVRWKSSDDVHISEVVEGNLQVEDSPGSSNDSMDGNLSDQSIPYLKSSVPPKRRISLEHKVASRLLESIVEIHDEVTRSPSGSHSEYYQSHSAELQADRL